MGLEVEFHEVFIALAAEDAPPIRSKRVFGVEVMLEEEFAQFVEPGGGES